MPCLPHDPSIYLDESTVSELVIDFSMRLRRNAALRTVLNRLVGNRWLEFEQGFGRICESILLQQEMEEDLIDVFFAHFDALSADDLAEAGGVFLDACLASLPLHAAASVNELFEKAAEVLYTALAENRTAEAAHRARTILTAGHVFR